MFSLIFMNKKIFSLIFENNNILNKLNENMWKTKKIKYQILYKNLIGTKVNGLKGIDVPILRDGKSLSRDLA